VQCALSVLYYLCPFAKWRSDLSIATSDVVYWLQMSETVEDTYVYHALGDMLYHIEHEGELPEF